MPQLNKVGLGLTATGEKAKWIEHPQGIRASEVGKGLYINLSSGERDGVRPYVMFYMSEKDASGGIGGALHSFVRIYYGTFMDYAKLGDKSPIQWQGTRDEPIIFQNRLERTENGVTSIKPIDIDHLYNQIIHLSHEQDYDDMKDLGPFGLNKALREDGKTPQRIGKFVPIPNYEMPILKGFTIEPYEVGNNLVNSFTHFLWTGELNSINLICRAFAQAGRTVIAPDGRVMSSPAMLLSIRDERIADNKRRADLRVANRPAKPSAEEIALNGEIDVLFAKKEELETIGAPTTPQKNQLKDVLKSIAEKQARIAEIKAAAPKTETVGLTKVN